METFKFFASFSASHQYIHVETLYNQDNFHTLTDLEMRAQFSHDPEQLLAVS